MDHQEARQLLDLRDRALQHLHEAQEFMLEVEARCAACQPEKIVTQHPRPRRRRRHLHVVKLALIGGGIGAAARKIALITAAPAMAATVAVTAVTAPDVTPVSPGPRPAMLHRSPRLTTPPGRRRPRRQAVPGAHQPPGRGSPEPGSPSPGKSSPARVASPSPSPSHGTPPAAPSPSPSSSPSPSPGCTLNLPGICVRL